MKALYFLEHGEFDKLRFADLKRPLPHGDELLLRVTSCALNHLDLFVLRGWKGLNLPFSELTVDGERAHIGGADISGQVDGQSVVILPGYSPTLKGEKECLDPSYQIFGETRSGGLAEYACIPKNCIYSKPEGFSDTEAASMLLVGLTSLRMLTTRAALRDGETALIVGAGGGVNSFSIQLAKCLGARVVALSSSEEKCRRAEELGADVCINYKDFPDWHREVLALGGADVVVDNVGSSTMNSSLKSAKRGGRIVTVGNTSGHELKLDNRQIFTKQLSILGSTMGNRSDFEALLSLLREKRIKPVVDQVFPLEKGAEAYQRLEEGTGFGKIVIQP